MTEQSPRAVTVAEALAQIPGSAEEHYADLFHHGSLEVGMYAPRGEDPQSPHTQDEVYIVVHGEGMFLNGDVRESFGPGDFLFVPAGVEHRFEEFSDDLAVWAIFYGPEGGERDT